MIRLILGSQSPRRKEILNFFALPFIQIPSTFDEESIPFSGNPVQYAQELSLGKAKELATRFQNDAILTADTVVFCEGNVYNKPRDEAEAFSMLRTFSGKWHQVITAVTVVKNCQVYSGFEETKILFNPISDAQIRLYLQSCSFLDKAGAYAIQQAGSILISRIDGCYYNVMGLPVNTVKEMLSKIGIDLWQHLKTC